MGFKSPTSADYALHNARSAKEEIAKLVKAGYLMIRAIKGLTKRVEVLEACVNELLKAQVSPDDDPQS